MVKSNIFSVSKLYFVTATRRAKVLGDTFRYVTEMFIAFRDFDGNYHEVFSNYNFGAIVYDPAFIKYKSNIPYLTTAIPLKTILGFEKKETIESDKLFSYILNVNLHERSALDY